ncbi:MAG: MarR family transcriptional regulator, partial [Hyphomicrobiaceae bacterium]|nr:MarR family transcriptional regulator [Hyphomicrobiaceae bacterium]
RATSSGSRCAMPESGPPDLTGPLRERLAEVDRQLEVLKPLNNERQRLLRALAALGAPTAEPTHITRQQQQILTVLEHGGRMRANDIAQQLGYKDANSIQTQLKGMYEKGLVHRYDTDRKRTYEWEAARD